MEGTDSGAKLPRQPLQPCALRHTAEPLLVSVHQRAWCGSPGNDMMQPRKVPRTAPHKCSASAVIITRAGGGPASPGDLSMGLTQTLLVVFPKSIHLDPLFSFLTKPSSFPFVQISTLWWPCASGRGPSCHTTVTNATAVIGLGAEHNLGCESRGEVSPCYSHVGRSETLENT